MPERVRIGLPYHVWPGALTGDGVVAEGLVDVDLDTCCGNGSALQRYVVGPRKSHTGVGAVVGTRESHRRWRL